MVPMNSYSTACHKWIPASAAMLTIALTFLIAPATARADDSGDSLEQPAMIATTLLHTFGFGIGPSTSCTNLDGADPKGSLTFANGFLFGRTFTTTAKGNLDGIVFHVAPDGTSYSIDHKFTGATSDGSDPRHDAMTLDGTVLYGTTLIGGKHNTGTIFSINDDGSPYTELHSFDKGAANNHGDMPHSCFALSSSGVLFGMTSQGGANGGAKGFGTIFSFDPATSTYTLLHSFGGKNGGSDPRGQPIFDPTGTILYGMTRDGGSENVGIVFSFDLSGKKFTTLHQFICPNKVTPTCVSNQDGASPDHGDLVQSGTKLFGMTTEGGHKGMGLIFSYDLKSKTFADLHNFGSSATDGVNPLGSLLLIGSTLYGTTSAGGSAGLGTVFQINTDGTGYAHVHDFKGGNSDGANPADNVIVVNNILYGMTEAGGKCKNGVIFSIALP